VGQAWVKYARENVHPTASKEQLLEIKDWYADEIRQLNTSFGDNDADVDMPVPVTARVVENTYRFAAAFARLHLSETITETHVKRAKSLVKQLVSQNWDGDTFTPPEVSRAQKGNIEAVYNVIDNNGPIAIEDIPQQAGVTERKADHYVEKLASEGRIMEPTTGEYRSV